jgi:hypothetical protein
MQHESGNLHPQKRWRTSENKVEAVSKPTEIAHKSENVKQRTKGFNGANYETAHKLIWLEMMGTLRIFLFGAALPAFCSCGLGIFFFVASILSFFF